MEIFVFGSNLAGRHGKGAAQDAHRFYGAEMGVGCGPTGMSYAIPTKDAAMKSLPLDVVAHHIAKFVVYAKGNPKYTFLLTPIGCGLAGNSKSSIWRILKENNIPTNVLLTSSWVTDA